MRYNVGMELRHLRYFLAVADERSFTKAAARLNMAQPPLSQQIRKLEREVGGPLFLRSSRNVELTLAGELLLEHAREILAAAERSLTSVRRAAAGEQGEVRIGFSGTATYDLMPFVARAYSERMPDVTLHLQGEMPVPEQVKALRDDLLDVGLIRVPMRTPDLSIRIVRRDPLIAVLPESHPLCSRRRIALSDLAPDRFISYPSTPPSAMYSVMLEACNDAGFVPQIRHEVRETSSLVSLVAAGLGVAVVPASVRHLRIPGAVHRPIEGCNATSDLAIAWRDNEQSPVIVNCIKIVCDLVTNFVDPYAGVGNV